MPVVVLRVTDRIGGRQPGEQTRPLLNQTLGALQCAAVYIRAARVVKQRQTYTQIGIVGAAQQIALIDYRRDAAGQLGQPKALPLHQHMRQPRVHR